MGFKTASILEFNYNMLSKFNGKKYADYFVKTYGEAPIHFMVNTNEDIETKTFPKGQYIRAVKYQQTVLDKKNKQRLLKTIQ